MKRILAGATVALAASGALAADGDMRRGQFTGMFCGMDATFHVQWEYLDSWTFDGAVAIHATGERDKIKIVQYDDNSIRITRYLSGANIGQTQRVETDPPILVRHAGYVEATFAGWGGRGLGCGRSAETVLRIRNPG